MLKKVEFTVVEVCDDGLVINHYLRGRAITVKQNIRKLMKQANRYEMFGNEGLIVWT